MSADSNVQNTADVVAEVGKSVSNGVNSVANSAFTEKLGSKVLGWVDAFEEVTKQYAPDVVKAALEVVRYSCANQLFYYWMLLFAGVALVTFGLRNLREKMGIASSTEGVFDCATVVAKVVSLITGALMTIIAFFHVINVWLYVGLVEPKVYVARMAMEKIVTLPDMYSSKK